MFTFKKQEQQVFSGVLVYAALPKANFALFRSLNSSTHPLPGTPPPPQ